MFKYIKARIESKYKLKIYRNSMPHGADIFFDLNKYFALSTFRNVFDVGANIGQSALKFIEVFPNAEIYSFEPVASTYIELVNNTKNYSQIRCINSGIGKVKGNVLINVNLNNGDSSILHRRPADHQEMIVIDAISNFCRESKIEKIDFLKTDTEGFEMEVLEGSQSMLEQQQIRIIVVECSPIAKTKDLVPIAEISQYLFGFKYELFGIYDQVFAPEGKRNIEFFNAVFVCPEIVANSFGI